MSKITPLENTLISGDPLAPSCSDLIAQTGLLEVGRPLPEGWRVLTGNNKYSTVARVAMRDEIEVGQ